MRLDFARSAAILLLAPSVLPLVLGQTPVESSAPPQQRTTQKTPLPGLAGTYAGTLQAGDAQLHLVLHVVQNPDGTLGASLDSLDQSVFAIEASHVAKTNSKLKLDVASVGAHFEGTISPDHKTIDGTWAQGNAALPLVFHRRPANSAFRRASDALFPVEGNWQSALETHGMRLRLQLHVSHDTERELVAALDSLDQGVSGLPAANVSLEETYFTFEIPAVRGHFEGKFDAGKNTLTGRWTQTGAEQDLVFNRSDEPLRLLRPQTPATPYPYREEIVSFTNPSANVELAGTITLPKGPGPFSAAILIAGSGPHDRDETMSGHKPFLVLADYLTRKGIAILRYDKRGTGASTGSVDQATTLDLASDAQAAIAYLKTRREIDPRKIGLIGHSEGAMIAPCVANHSQDVNWVVLLAPPATKGEDTLMNQSGLIGEVGGLSEPQVLASLTFDHESYDLVRSEKDPAVLTEKLKQLVKDSGMDAALPPAALETQLRMLTSPWFRFFLEYDPLPALQALKTPTLALYGQKDLQVPPKFNLQLTKKALTDAGNSDFDVRELPDLNHYFQHAYSGSPAEYQAIEETISPGVLLLLSEWILPRAGLLQ